MEINVRSAPIHPELPKVLDNEQINVYVPFATNEYAGISSYDYVHFEFKVPGQVSIHHLITETLKYVRRTLDPTIDNLALIQDDDSYRNILFKTTAKNVIDAINENHDRINTHEIKIGSGEIITPDNLQTGESGLVGLSNANYRKLNAFIVEARQKHTEIDGRLDNHDDQLEEHTDRLVDHGLKITGLRTDVDTINNKIGPGEPNTVNKTIIGAINENFDLSKSVERTANTNRVNLVSLTAQMQGVARSYSLETFDDFLKFIDGELYIELLEDRDGDGIAESYKIYSDNLITGDNILIVEMNVADFWFEKNAEISNAERYEYDGNFYDLIVYNASGSIIGSMHVLETDYNVIRNHAISARQSADEARASELAALQYKNETEALANSIYVKQVAPPLSLLSTAIVLTTPTLSQI